MVRWTNFFRKNIFILFLGLTSQKFIAQILINKTDSIIEFAKKQIGINYKYGSYNPNYGFDCSGLLYYVFREFKVNVPRSSKEYYNYGKTVALDSVKIGDVLLFEKPGHVAIVVSKNETELLFIHSSSDKRHSGVKISNYYLFANYKKRFVKTIRVL